MHFQGRELISRGTKATSRTLLSICFAKIFVVYFAVNISSAKIAGVDIGEADLGLATSLLIIFLLVSHGISWIGDVLSFRRWNVSEKVSQMSGWGGGGVDTHLLTKIDGVLASLEALKEEANGNTGRATGEQLKKIVLSVSNTHKLVEGIKGGISDLTFFAWFVLFGWYAIFPIIMASTAIYLNVDTGT